jgi:hypothetical protein
MAFAFDSFSFIAAALLLAAALIGWRWLRPVRPAVRLTLRFAILLFAALACAGLAASLWPPFAAVLIVVALLVASLGSTALALGLFAIFSRRVPPLTASLALVLALAGGLGAGLAGQPVFALAIQILACSVIIVSGFGRLGDALLCGAQTIAGGFALLCAGMALMDGAVPIALLFLAAALLGLARALQFGVEQPRRGHSGGLIG